jgi:Ca2+-transporting ATPase
MARLLIIELISFINNKMTKTNPFPFAGLTEEEVKNSRKKFGSNKIETNSKSPFWHSLKDAVTEPMFILLVAAAIIYFVLGEFSDAWFMSGAIILVSAISIYQDNRSRNALNSLKEFTQPHATVIRNNEVGFVLSEEIVVGDFVVVSEGELVPADGRVQQLNDFSVNESILTGESFSVTKDINSKENDKVFSGTLAESGQCLFEVTAVGDQTQLGLLGKSIQNIQKEKTPLQKQINTFVKWMALAGGIIFLIIWGINYFKSYNILDSLLKGLTIAMSVLPEEIPVALATFMALGAWRLMKMGIIVKDTSTVEALGAATVLCTDKTGTITENKMELYQLYDFIADKKVSKENWKSESAQTVISSAMWASESVPFNPMEKAIHHAYEENIQTDQRPEFKMVHEYPLEGNPPMMTHIFENKNGERIIAVKGAPETILKHSLLNVEENKKINHYLDSFAKEGLRVLGVGIIEFKGTDFPKTQQEFTINFLGLLGFYDPPKKNIAHVFKQLYDAGIKLKIITGDNPVTTAAIAKQAHFRGYEKTITSTELLALNKNDFDKAVIENSLFTRMFPEVKLKIVESLKLQNHIVGMTGDGVNDGPALKAANIGIAMGKRGSEIAKEASSLILTDDDFGKMVDAVAMGRKIYTNLKKAIQYIISIHIPIILTVALPLILGWIYTTIFTPVHVIFLELIMGPTCSIVYENEPLEKNAMLHPPRKMTTTFFNIKELSISIFQGLAITAGTLFIYQVGVQKGYTEEMTRSLVFTTLIFANLFLTLVNRSFYFSFLSTLRNKNVLLQIVIIATLTLLALILYTPSFSSFFRIASLNGMQIIWSIATAFVSVVWFEIFKWKKRRTSY